MKNWCGSLAVRVGAAIVVAVSIAATSADAAQARKRKPAPPPPKDAALIVDATSGRVLYERDAFAIRHPASLTKMMTLYMLFEALNEGSVTMETPLVASHHSASMSPTKLNLRPGESVQVDTAIRSLVIQSANDVAATIAEHLGGTESNFGQMMTRKARELGMKQSVFVNASGLPDVRQVTTAHDMAILGRRLAYDFPRYYTYFSLREFTYKGRTYRTHNRVMTGFNGADGIKTGYTRMSGFNLVTSVVRDNKHVVGVVMGGRTGASRDAEMKRLLGIAFEETEKNPLLVAHANVPWSGQPGPYTAPDWTAPVPPTITLAGFEGKKAPGLPQLPPPEAPVATAPPTNIVADVVTPKEKPLPKHAILPLPKPMIVADVPVPADDPIAKLIAQEASSAAGIDGVSFVPAGRLAKILPAPKPVMLSDKPRLQAASLGDDAQGVNVIRPAGRGKSWAIQIGAFADKISAHAQLAKYAEKSMDVLGQARRLVVAVPDENGRTTYRARFGLFGEDEARAVCRRMTSRGETCFAVEQAT